MIPSGRGVVACALRARSAAAVLSGIAARAAPAPTTDTATATAAATSPCGQLRLRFSSLVAFILLLLASLLSCVGAAWAEALTIRLLSVARLAGGTQLVKHASREVQA